jgi:hypothetical protein
MSPEPPPDLQQFVAILSRRWGTTLAMFRDEALKEPSGIAFKSFHSAHRVRGILVVCVSEEGEIRRLEEQFDFSKPAAVDWKKTTIPEFTAQAVLKRDRGLFYDFQKDTSHQTSALLLAAVEPHSITILEDAFNLPP